MSTQAAPHYISRVQLMAMTGLSDTTVWRLVRRGDLPAPVRLSPGRVAWPAHVIDQWLASRTPRHCEPPEAA